MQDKATATYAYVQKILTYNPFFLNYIIIMLHVLNSTEKCNKRQGEHTLYCLEIFYGKLFYC